MQSNTPPASVTKGTAQKADCWDIDTALVGQRAITAMDAGLMVLDLRGRLIWANPSYCRMVGRDLNTIVGGSPFEFAVPEASRLSPGAIAAIRFTPGSGPDPDVSTLRKLRADGTEFWAELRTTFDHFPGHGDAAIVVVRDVTEQIAQKRALADRTADFQTRLHEDDLTGLMNRRGMMAALDTAIQSAAWDGRGIGLIDIDVDHLKSVNDAYGFAAGDALLCHVAKQLNKALTPDDIAARVGGDEFMILCNEVSSAKELSARSAQLIKSVSAPIELGRAALSASITAGAALSTSEDRTPTALLKRANFALFDAKQQGRGKTTIYDSALHARKQNEDLIARELEQALVAEQMSFAFQPTIDAIAHRVSGFETLVRWINPRLGPVSPATFLPIAKASGLLGQLDQAAFEAAVAHKKRLMAEGHSGLRIGFNGSAEFLAQENFVEVFLGTLQAENIPPEEFVLEVLETVVFRDTSDENPLVLALRKLNEAGVMVMLDDFGTGYAGLTHLASLAVSGVKIDRSLTMNVLKATTSAKIIAMMYDLCRDLQLSVVTEGVETQDEVEAIIALGGRFMQGYRFARAMPADETIRFLENWDAPIR